MKAAKKKLTKQCRTKKNVPYKNDCCQKIGAKQLKKIAPYKNDWGQKNLNQTVYDKKIRIKMTVAKKNRNKSVAKNGNL